MIVVDVALTRRGAIVREFNVTERDTPTHGYNPARAGGDGQESRRQVGARDAWEESQHPRGQPKNAGEFVSKGAGVHVTATAAPGVAIHAPHYMHTQLVENPPSPSPAPAQLSWEAAPGRTSHMLPGFHNASFEQRQEYQRAVETVLEGDNGGDAIAQGMGLLTLSTFEGPGVFEGHVNPGAQAQAAQNLDALSNDSKARLTVGECVRGLLLHQDAVAWHKPRFLPQHVKGPYLIPALKIGPFNYAVAGRLDQNGNSHSDAYLSMSQDMQDKVTQAGIDEDRSNFMYLNDKGEYLNDIAARRYAEANSLLTHHGEQFNGIRVHLISEHLKPEASNPGAMLRDEDADVIDYDIGRTLSPEEAQQLDAAMAKEFGMSFFAPIATPTGWRFRNVHEATGIGNFAFQRRTLNAMDRIESETLPEQAGYRFAASDGDFVSNDWSKDTKGEEYQKTIDAAGPDVSRAAAALYARLAPKIAEVEQAFAKRYNWASEGGRPAGEGNTRDSQALGAGVAIIDPDGRMLFLRRSAQAEQHAGHWDFPGGGIEDDEEPQEAAARECHEEAGYHPHELHPDIFPEVAGDGWHFTTFAHPVDRPFEPELNDEHDAHCWATAEEAMEHLPLRPGIRQTLTETRDAYDPSEPRVGKGSPEGGEWTKGEFLNPIVGAGEKFDRNKWVRHVPVYKNPHAKELLDFSKLYKDTDIRGIMDEDTGNVFWFTEESALHAEMAEALKLKHVSSLEVWTSEKEGPLLYLRDMASKHALTIAKNSKPLQQLVDEGIGVIAGTGDNEKIFYNLDEAIAYALKVNKKYMQDSACGCGGTCAKCRDQRMVFHAYGSVA